MSICIYNCYYSKHHALGLTSEKKNAAERAREGEKESGYRAFSL
jgi:hypothetical protein